MKDKTQEELEEIVGNRPHDSAESAAARMELEVRERLAAAKKHYNTPVELEVHEIVASEAELARSGWRANQESLAAKPDHGDDQS